MSANQSPILLLCRSMVQHHIAASMAMVSCCVYCFEPVFLKEVGSTKCLTLNKHAVNIKYKNMLVF